MAERRERKEMQKITCEVIEHVATISEASNGFSLELNKISYDGKPAKLDLRRWKALLRGDKKMLKGVTLTREEAEALRDALNEVLREDET